MPARERSGPVRVLARACASSALAIAAIVALPADIDLEDRAARMNAFWDKLVEFQHRDVLIVALCVDEER